MRPRFLVEARLDWQVRLRRLMRWWSAVGVTGSESSTQALIFADRPRVRLHKRMTLRGLKRFTRIQDCTQPQSTSASMSTPCMFPPRTPIDSAEARGRCCAGRATSVPERAEDHGHQQSPMGTANGLGPGHAQVDPCLKRPSRQTVRHLVRSAIGSGGSHARHSLKSLSKGATRGKPRRRRTRSMSRIGSGSGFSMAVPRDGRTGGVGKPERSFARPFRLCPHEGAAYAGTGHRVARRAPCPPWPRAGGCDDAGTGRNRR